MNEALERERRAAERPSLSEERYQLLKTLLREFAIPVEDVHCRALLTAIEQMKPSRVTPSPVVTSGDEKTEPQAVAKESLTDEQSLSDLLNKMSPESRLAFSRGCNANAQDPLIIELHKVVELFFSVGHFGGDGFNGRDWAFDLAETLLLALISEQTGIVLKAERDRRTRDHVPF